VVAKDLSAETAKEQSAENVSLNNFITVKSLIL
jgi:hypothetical protein